MTTGAIAAFAAGGPPLSPEAVARHMIRTARRGGFLSAPGWKLRAIAAVGGIVPQRLAAFQMRLLARMRAP